MKNIDIVREYQKIQFNMENFIYEGLNGSEKLIRILHYDRCLGTIDNSLHRFNNQNYLNLTSTGKYIYISILKNELLISVNELGHGIFDGKEIILDLNDTDLEMILKDTLGVLRMDVEENEKYFRGYGIYQ
mgnify:CR=1 FL=1